MNQHGNNNILIKQSNTKPLVIAWFLALIGVPVIAQLLFWLIVYLFFSIIFYWIPSVEEINATGPIIFTLCFIFYSLIIARAGYLHGKFRHAGKNYKGDYLPFILVIMYVLISWIVMGLITKGNMSSDTFINFLFIAHPPFIPISFLLINTDTTVYFPYFILATYSFFLIASIYGARKNQSPVLLSRKMVLIFTSLFIALSLILTWQLNHQKSWLINVTDSDEKITIREELDLNLYRPFSLSKLLTPLRTKAELAITENYPRIDGAISLYPIYASAVEAIYRPGSMEDINLILDSIKVTRTATAYQRLVNNETDMIIVAKPSKSQIEFARQNGVELSLTPIAKGALVFVVSKKNPVNNLSVIQIKDIYSGRITNWREINGANRPILAFQHPKDSGSQTIMEADVMQNKPMKEPLQNEYGNSMGEVLYEVTEYKNATNAIGYMFRFYVTTMNKRDDIRLLAINGIEPTPQNIRNNKYPFVMDLYIVTAKSPSENTKKLIDWFLSPQGQTLIEDVGYIPIHDPHPH